MKKFWMVLCLTGFIVYAVQGQNHSDLRWKDSLVISLWDGHPPFSKNKSPEKLMPDKGDNIIRLTNVTDPTITIYQSKRPQGNGAARPAVIICPGGGYSILAINLEGTEIADWFNSLDVIPVLLKYRVPDNRKGAYADAQRAMHILRSRADEFNIDPGKIGIMGFSAGGHLSARMSTHFTQQIYNSTDGYDKASMRPDFGILIYPAYLANKQHKLAEEVEIDDNTPPVFIVQAQDDPVGYRNSLFFYNALGRHMIPGELHLFAHGGHGYGMRVNNTNPLSQWPVLCKKWLRSIGIIN